MNKKVSLSEVEERVRATLQARSQDSTESASARPPTPATVSAAGHRPPAEPAPVASEEAAEPGVATPPVSRDAGPTRKRLVAAAATVAVLTGVGVYVAGRSGEGGLQADVRSAPVAEGPSPVSLPTCGTELPVAVSVPGAEPVEGPMPGADPAEPGQVVVHWQRADLSVEARWPARPQPVYDLRPATPPPRAIPSSVFTADDPPSAELDIITGDGGAPEIVVEGAVTPRRGCDLMELSYVDGGSHTRYGLQFPPGADGAPDGSSVDPHGADMGRPYGLVDLNPLVKERREVTEAPDTVACRSADVPSRSGPADPRLRGNTPPEALQAFVASGASRLAPHSGYVEMIQPDGSITYGFNATGEGWNVLVTVTPGPDHDSWYLAGWRTSC